MTIIVMWRVVVYVISLLLSGVSGAVEGELGSEQKGLWFLVKERRSYL
jgi:hypothetical protein